MDTQSLPWLIKHHVQLLLELGKSVLLSEFNTVHQVISQEPKAYQMAIGAMTDKLSIRLTTRVVAALFQSYTVRTSWLLAGAPRLLSSRING